jgi:toxin ParE1/3/4
MKPVRFHPKPSKELEAAALYYDEKRPGLGALFLAEAKKSRDRIVELPIAAREVRDSIRRRSVYGFPYFLYYSVEEHEIFVIAVAHKRRHPDYWEKRLKAT